MHYLLLEKVYLEVQSPSSNPTLSALGEKDMDTIYVMRVKPSSPADAKLTIKSRDFKVYSY